MKLIKFCQIRNKEMNMMLKRIVDTDIIIIDNIKIRDKIDNILIMDIILIFMIFTDINKDVIEKVIFPLI